MEDFDWSECLSEVTESHEGGLKISQLMPETTLAVENRSRSSVGSVI